MYILSNSLIKDKTKFVGNTLLPDELVPHIIQRRGLDGYGNLSKFIDY